MIPLGVDAAMTATTPAGAAAAATNGAGFLDGLLAALDATSVHMPVVETSADGVPSDQPVVATVPHPAVAAVMPAACPCCTLVGAPSPQQAVEPQLPQPPAVTEPEPTPVVDTTPTGAAFAATDTVAVDVDVPVLAGSVTLVTPIDVLDAPVMSGPIAAPAATSETVVAPEPAPVPSPARSADVDRAALQRLGWAQALMPTRPAPAVATDTPVPTDAAPAVAATAATAATPVEPSVARRVIRVHSDIEIDTEPDTNTEGEAAPVVATTASTVASTVLVAEAPRRPAPSPAQPAPAPTTSISTGRSRHVPTVPAIRVHDDAVVPFRAATKHEHTADAAVDAAGTAPAAPPASDVIDLDAGRTAPVANAAPATPTRSSMPAPTGAPTSLGMVSSNLAGVDRVRFAREQAPARAVQRLSLDLDGAQVAVKFHGDRIAVDVVNDPTGSLGNGWARGVERTLDQAVRTVAEPRDSRGEQRGQPDGSSRHGGQQGEAGESRQQRRQRSFEQLAQQQTAGGDD